MRRGLTGPLAAALLLAACSPGTAVAPSPTPSPAPGSPSAEPSPTPSPQPLQRFEVSLPAAVEETAAASAGGRLYVMGGFNAAGASLNNVFVFDGTRWSSGPRLPIPLDHASAATLDDHVYIAGGHSNGADSARLYRLDGNRWTELARMHYARGGHALIAAAGRLYAIGGNTAGANVAPTEEYSPSSNAWTVLTPVPQPRNHVAGFVLGSLACVAGGRSPNTARVDCFDTTSRAWTRLAGLPAPTSGAGAAAIGASVVVAGGEDAGENRMVTQLAFYLSGRWSSGPKMLVPRHGFELALFNGRAWACGGGSAPGLHPVATCTSLGDPATSEG
jgi:Kelch motif